MEQFDSSTNGGSEFGAYGLKIVGLPAAAKFLTPVDPSAETLIIERLPAGSLGPERFDDDGAVLTLAGNQGTVRLDRRSLTASFVLAESFSDEAILHPFASGSAAIVNRWLGRDTFHAGAFLAGAGAWALIGDKGQGKSSTLGYLAASGVPILTDDLLILDGADAHAGPAFIDLRPDAAEKLGRGRDMGVLGARARFRLSVPTPPARVPLLGWVILAWADSVELVEVPLAKRLKLLFDNRAVWRDPPNPATFLTHAALPMWELRRPQRWSVLPDVLGLLRGHLFQSQITTMSSKLAMPTAEA